MKAKSSKLRTLIALKTLFKYSDEDHRLNTRVLNEYLKPYGLEGTRVALSGMLSAFREYGLDIKEKGRWDNHGYWLENTSLSSDNIENIVFAVSTNPHLSQEQATSILSALKPFVTVYQEPMFKSICKYSTPSNEHFKAIYSVIHQGIVHGKLVLYSKRSSSETEIEQHRILPKCVYPLDGSMYLVGYIPIKRMIEVVNFDDIDEIALYHTYCGHNKELSNQILSEVDIEDYIRNKLN